MNYWRWLTVGYLLTLMVFTTSVLLIPGEKYRTLTTSDSGWFFGIARELNSADGMVEKYSLSHAPYGMGLGSSDHGQPLLLVMLYRGLHALDPDLSPMDVCRYWSPLLFALVLIPIFLIGKELGGDRAGYGAAFFCATLGGSIYWCKLGAFDEEALQLVFTAWVVYLMVKSFKTRGWATLKFGILGGLVFGIFGLSWGGFLYLATILVLWLFLAVLSEWLRYLAPIFLIGMLIAVHSGEITYMLYAFVGAIGIATVVEVAEALFRRVSVGAFLRGFLRAFRTHLLLIGSVVAMFGVTTATVVYLGGASPSLWEDFARQQMSFAGIGRAAEGVSFARYAGEMTAPVDWDATINRIYIVDKNGNGRIEPGSEKTALDLTRIALALTAFGLIGICWTRKRWELLMLAWSFVLLGLVWPGKGQVRFDRQWWPFVAVMAGVGIGTLASAFRRIDREPAAAEWLGYVQKPVALALCASLISIPFISNAYVQAEITTPPTEWHGSGLDEGFMEAFAWLHENTLENSVVAIEWSFGHVLTGTAERATVTDGCETAEKVGKWENDPIRPPDYTYRVIGNKGVFLERFVPWEAPPLGRRSDMQWIFALDDEELADLLELYRDNYDTRIDYLVFHLANPWTTQDAVSRPSLKDVEAETRSLELVGENFLFNFGGENVVLDTRTGEVRRNGDNLIGYILGEEVRDGDGNIFHLHAGQSFPHLGDAGVRKTLLVYFKRQEKGGRMVMAVMGGALCRAPEKPTVGTLIAYELLEEDSYLQTVHRSRISWPIYGFYIPLVKVVKVNHVPSLISPTEGACTNDDTPTFRWSKAVGATRYEIWVDNDSDFSSPEILERVSGTSHTSTAVLADGIYSWRVRAFKADDVELGWSPAWTFAIDTTPPAAAAPHAPGNGATTSDNSPTFEWELGEGATKHRLLVDDDNDFSSPEVEVTLDVPENTYTSSELAPGSYWWKVVAIDDANNESESLAWEFTVQV